VVPEQPGSPIPLPPAAPPADGGDAGTVAYVPEVQFSFDESAYRTMAEKSFTATFEDKVDDCGTPAVNALIEITDAIGVPISATYDYSWNEACTVLSLQNIPLTYATAYKVLFKQGLSFAGNLLEATLSANFTTLGNYYSINANRYADYPTILREDAMSPSWVPIYAGDDILPAVLPRDPLSFTPEDVTSVFAYAPESTYVSKHLNAGGGRFIFDIENNLGEEYVVLFRDLALAPVTIAASDTIQLIAFTDQSDPAAVSVNGNAIQDLAFVVDNSEMMRYELYVFYDWPLETADLTSEEADWSLQSYAGGYGMDMGDFNGDGRADLCTLSMDNWTESIDVECYLGSASGLADTPVVKFLFPGNDDPYMLRMSDVNCDGFSDVVVGGPSMDEFGALTSFISVFPGGTDVTGSLEIGVDITAALRIDSAETGLGLGLSSDDVDGDGCGDIFTAGSKNDPKLYAFKGGNTITYGNAQTVTALEAVNNIYEDADGSNTGSRFATYLDINGDGYNDLMYDEVVIDFELGIWQHKQLFVPGGGDFFGPDQTTKTRDETSAQFIDLVGPLAM
jgi:hypothetical protein